MPESSLYQFPAADASPEEVRGFSLRHFARYNAYRSRHMQRISLSLYYILGRQWVEQDIDILPEGARGFAIKDMAPNDEVELPRPVTNFIAPAVDVEFATLSKRQWVPKIPTYSRDPRMEAAAKVADDVLRDRLIKLGWDDIRDRFILNLCQMGTATLHSFWEESHYETVWTAVPEPHRCPVCSSLFSSASVPQALLTLVEGGAAATIRDVPEGGEQARMDRCPRCGGPVEPFDLDENTSHLTDLFGRPLGEMLPRGGTALELVTPFEYYPQNGGVMVTPETARQHGIAKVRSLDWVEEHHPELIDQVVPEPPDVLMREHPLLGEWDIVGRFDSAFDSGIYDHHVMVYDLYADPSYRFKEGRRIRIIGSAQQIVARNEPLLRKVTDPDGTVAAVPVACVASAVWKPREGEFWGKTLADDLISPQNRLNGIDSQVIEARERMGSPNLMVPNDANLEGPEYRASYGCGKIFKFDPSAVNPASEPKPFGSMLMPSGVNLEWDKCAQAMTRIIGPADIEIGEAPRNITTTSGLQILGEQAERRRATRERGITSAFKKVWEHQLQMLWVLRVDTDTYEAKLPDGSWEIRQYERQHLAGQTKVEIERQAYIDRSIIVRESTRQALVDGLYDASTPMARKKLLELQGLPTDVNEDTNLQIDHARRQWVDFVDDRKVPVIDPTLDNPTIRFHVLGTMMLQDEGQRIAEAALWPQILPVIAGWEEEYAILSAHDDRTRAQYGGEPDPQTAAETYARLMLSYQQAKAAYDQSAQMAVQSPGMAQPPATPPPEEPLPPVFLPKQPEKRVYLVWQGIFKKRLGDDGLAQMVLAAAVQRMIDPMEMSKAVNAYLQFRSVVEAYKLMGVPTMAPGSTPNPAPESGPPAPGAPMPGMQRPGPPPTPATPPQPPTPVG